MKSLKTAFIFTSSRDKIIKKFAAGEAADTALRSLNHFPGADYFTIPPKSLKSFIFIPKLLKYNFIIAQDNLFLGFIISIISKIFRLKTKWLYVAINSSTLIKRHAQNRFHLFLLKTFWRSYAHIICLSQEQLEDFVKIGVPRSHLSFIPFGVDGNFFQLQNSPEEKDIILSIGRDAGRDYVTLFKAAEETPFPWTVVASKKNISPDSSIPQNISVFYDKSILEIRDLFKQARVLVVVSKDSDVLEGSDCSGQTVILEGMVAGLPVIATRRSWIKDYFIPDKDILLVEPNDPKNLAEAIKKLWNNDEKRKQIAISGHEKVIANYTTKIFAKNLEALMNSLV